MGAKQKHSLVLLALEPGEPVQMGESPILCAVSSVKDLRHLFLSAGTECHCEPAESEGTSQPVTTARNAIGEPVL